MSKFKVGDKVKIVRSSVNSNLSLSERNIAIGEEYVIESVNPNSLNTCRDHYGLVGSNFVVYDYELELVASKPFTKSDLKDGMVVEYRCGWMELVLGEKTVDGTGSHSLCNFDDELINKESRDSDIIRVYTVNDDITSTGCIFDHAYLNCIWEREEEPKPKYKPGDRVKMRENLATGKFAITVWPDMAKMAGKVTTIKHHVFNTYYLIDDVQGYVFTEDMIEGLVDYEEMTVADIEKKLGYKIKVVGDTSCQK